MQNPTYSTPRITTDLRNQRVECLACKTQEKREGWGTTVLVYKGRMLCCRCGSDLGPDPDTSIPELVAETLQLLIATCKFSENGFSRTEVVALRHRVEQDTVLLQGERYAGWRAEVRWFYIPEPLEDQPGRKWNDRVLQLQDSTHDVPACIVQGAKTVGKLLRTPYRLTESIVSPDYPGQKHLRLERREVLRTENITLVVRIEFSWEYSNLTERRDSAALHM